MASYSRQGTGLTGRPKGSPPPRRMTIPFAQKAKLPPPENPALKQAVYPVYLLKWEKLKAFLEERFPGYTFQERRVNNDHYLFEIPEDLTQAYAARLDTAEPNLLTKPEAELYVPFRDLYPACQGPKTHNILSDDVLRKWLGDQSSIDPLTSTRNGAIATKADPICRFIFISGGNSREPLKISRRMLTRILTYHQVMPCYLDFMSVFGLSKSARELRFSGFRAQVLLKNPAPDSAIPDLGRSGRHFQMCYNLKSVARVPDEKRVLWSIRQAAIYHQFDIEKGTALWIVTKGNLEIKDRIKTLTGKDGRAEDRAFDTPEQCLKSSLAVHLLHCHWSTEDWRWYVQSLEDQIDTETEIAVHGPRGNGEAVRGYTSADLQTLQNYQDKMNEIIMILEANNDVLASLRDFYKAMHEDSTFTLGNACCEELTLFAKQIDELKHDSAMQVSRARLLVQITSDRKNLVSWRILINARGGSMLMLK
ncbi:MAG: hypothetical protein Q9210_002830 [Variospora velana]